MKSVLFNIIAGIGAGVLLLSLLSCIKAPQTLPVQEKQDEKKDESQMPERIKITISGSTLQIVIENNAATKALVEALREAPVTYTASDYGGFEKVGPLGRSLPADNSQITTQPGDVILYSGNQIVLFYGSNSWRYTRIGRMEYNSLNELKSFLKAGEGDISVTLSL